MIKQESVDVDFMHKKWHNEITLVRAIAKNFIVFGTILAVLASGFVTPDRFVARAEDEGDDGDGASFPLPPECANIADEFNRIDGTEDDEALEGTDENDVIFGYGGNDVINGNGGDDCIFGGDGDDVITTGEGDDIVMSENGNDVVKTGDGDDGVVAGDGHDIVATEGGDDWLDGGGGYDICVPGAEDDAAENCEPVNPPDADPPPGNYTSLQNVSLAAGGAATIRYTTDAIPPECESADGRLYEEPLRIFSSLTLQAISCYADIAASEIAAFSYAIDELRHDADDLTTLISA